jgi:RNA polymerase sigma-70 factor (ECF subfamily)
VPAPLEVVEVVAAMRAGDQAAYARLVEAFQDYAVACALGHGADLDSARDAAQQVFTDLPALLGQLREPSAFAAWLRLLIRTAVSRQRRADARKAVTALPEGVDDMDPAKVYELRARQQAVLHAVGALPEHERLVVALQYFAGHPHGAIAAFLGVPVSTVKKRAFDARKRLKELLDVLEPTLTGLRPSQTSVFSQTVVLFAAIRRGDAQLTERLVLATPSLLEAHESWDLGDALAAGLAPARQGSPLLRAAEFGRHQVVEVLLNAGAAVDGSCGCPTGESPLWAAAQAGHRDVVERLLASGADASRPAANGVTPLMIAAMRGDQGIAAVLRKAGAVPDARDVFGRTAEDWARLRDQNGEQVASVHTAEHDPATGGPALLTGVSAIDLLAPLVAGDAVAVTSSYGIGMLVLLAELCARLAAPPARTLWVGHASPQITATGLENGLAESGLAATAEVLLVEREDGEGLAQRVEASASAGRVSVAVLLHGEHHSPHLDALLPALRHRDGVALTFVVSPDRLVPSSRANAIRLEAVDAHLSFDSRRARAGLWPALDLTAITSRNKVSSVGPIARQPRTFTKRSCATTASIQTSACPTHRACPATKTVLISARLCTGSSRTHSSSLNRSPLPPPRPWTSLT